MASVFRSTRLSRKSGILYVALTVVTAGMPGLVSAQVTRYKACPPTATTFGVTLTKEYFDPDSPYAFFPIFTFDGHTGTFEGTTGATSGTFDFSLDEPKASASNAYYTLNFALSGAAAAAICQNQLLPVIPGMDSTWMDATMWTNPSGTPEALYNSDDLDEECGGGGTTGGGGDPESVTPAARGTKALDACGGSGGGTDYSYCVVEVEADANGNIILDANGDPIVLDVLYCEDAT